MLHRVNGIRTTVTPIPTQGQYSIVMRWLTIFFIPLVPLGWQFIRGAGGKNYYIVKDISYASAYQLLGTKGVILTLSYGMSISLSILIAFGGVIAFFHCLWRNDAFVSGARVVSPNDNSRAPYPSRRSDRIAGAAVDR
jgi:hypothetical protein